MQRIVFRYRRAAPAHEWNHSELRALLQRAAETAGLPTGTGQRVIVMGPPLPAEATSEAEYALIELVRPIDPAEVSALLNRHLPARLQLVRAWIARPGSPDENPATLDEAVYEVHWQRQAPSGVALTAAIQRFLAATEISFTRARERKTQQLNARALVQDMALLTGTDGPECLRMMVSVGPRGSLRPREVLQVLGFAPAPEDIHVVRVALQRSFWRHPSPAHRAPCWRRT